MNWSEIFTELRPPPSLRDLRGIGTLLPSASALLEFYRQHDGGIIDNVATYAGFYQITEIIAMREDGNGGWPLRYFFFGGDGASEGFGLLLDAQHELCFSTQWVSCENGISFLGSFDEFLRRVAAGDYI